MTPPVVNRPAGPRLLPLIALLAFGGRLAAQPAPVAANPTTPPALAAPGAPVPKAAAVEPKKADERQITDSDIANALIDSLPKFSPPKPDEDGPLSGTVSDTDQPKNGIIHLPKYQVFRDRSPVFTERNSYTKEGLEAIAIKRYLSDFDSKILDRWYIPFLTMSAGDRALQMYYEDERLANMRDLNQEADIISRTGDPAEGAFIKKATQDTYMRNMDWGWGAKGSLGLGADLGN
jgi:hypothetical protein